MVCKCVTDEGCPALDCDGSCIQARMINPLIQERAMEDSFTSNQLTQIRSILIDLLAMFTKVDEKWIEGFTRGFQEGYEYGQN